MKIAIWYNLPSGGAKRALHGHVRGLLERGHQVEAWCPPCCDFTYLPLAEMVPEHVVDFTIPPRTSWDKRLRIERAIAARVPPMIAHSQACAAKINQGGFDVLFANTCMHFASPFIGRYVTIPKVLYLQEPARGYYEAAPRHAWLPPEPSRRAPPSLAWLRERAAYLRRLRNAQVSAAAELDNARAYDRILVNSLYSRESVLRAYGLQSKVCYLGTKTDRGPLPLGPREPFFMGLGSFAPAKSLDLAIEAIARLPAPRPKLIWVGNLDIDDSKARATARAAELGVPFEALMRISDAALQDLLHRATALIYGPRLEPFGLAAIEAAASGLPVIGVAEAGLRETVIDGVTGMLVAATPQAIAAAAQRLLAEPELAARLGQQAARNARQTWSLDAANDRLEAALRDVVAQAGRPA